MRLKEENGVLARIWWEGSDLPGSQCKFVGVSSIHGQAKLAVMVKDDCITLLETEWVDNRSAFDAANAALSSSLNAASGPRSATPWTLLIYKWIIAKGGFMCYHRS